MKLSVLQKALADRGGTAEQIIALAEAFEAAQEDAAAHRREQAAIRQRRKRERDASRMSRAVTHVTRDERDSENLNDFSGERAPAHVVETSTFSDEKVGKEKQQENKQVTRAKRAARMPEDGQPDVDYALTKGLTHAEIRHETEMIRNWAAGNGIAKADWNATWRNWVLRKVKSDQMQDIAKLTADQARSLLQGQQLSVEPALNSRVNRLQLPQEWEIRGGMTTTERSTAERTKALFSARCLALAKSRSRKLSLH